MHNYFVYDEANDNAYNETVSIIAKTFPNLKKKKPIEDVDGSSVVTFLDGKTEVIDVYKDFDYNEVYVKSKIDLSHIDFSKITASA